MRLCEDVPTQWPEGVTGRIAELGGAFKISSDHFIVELKRFKVRVFKRRGLEGRHEREGKRGDVLPRVKRTLEVFLHSQDENQKFDA